MYTDINFKTGKALREAFGRGERLTVHQPGGFFESKTDGEVTVEGPHYPKPHSWYMRVRIANGAIVAVKHGSKWITAAAVAGTVA